jgi:hypothetical protein
MSKRKTPQSKATPLPQHLADMLAFRQANSELHTIRVSTPILRVVERLVADERFRSDVVKRMTSR